MPPPPLGILNICKTGDTHQKTVCLYISKLIDIVCILFDEYALPLTLRDDIFGSMNNLSHAIFFPCISPLRAGAVFIRQNLTSTPFQRGDRLCMAESVNARF